MERFFLLLLSVVTFTIVPTSLAAQEQYVLHITCTGTDGNVSNGSGVVVSDEGLVLTATHVAPRGSKCLGSIGDLEGTKFELVPRVRHEVFDAVLLSILDEVEPFEAVEEFCEISQELAGANVVAFGFHENSAGGPSRTAGIISTHLPGKDGLIETDARTSRGKSGGPVFLQDSGLLVGLVQGADFSSVGTEISFKILPIGVLAPMAPIKPSSQCPKIRQDKTDQTWLFQNEFLNVENVKSSFSMENGTVFISTKIHNTTPEPLLIHSAESFSQNHGNWAATDQGQVFSFVDIEPLEDPRKAGSLSPSDYIKIPPGGSVPVVWRAYTGGKAIFGQSIYFNGKFYRLRDGRPEIFSISFARAPFRKGMMDEKVADEHGAIHLDNGFEIAPIRLYKTDKNQVFLLAAEIRNVTDQRLMLARTYRSVSSRLPNATTDVGESFTMFGRSANGINLVRAQETDPDLFTWIEPDIPLMVVWFGRGRGQITGSTLSLSEELVIYEDGSVIPVQIHLDDIPFD